MKDVPVYESYYYYTIIEKRLVHNETFSGLKGKPLAKPSIPIKFSRGAELYSDTHYQIKYSNMKSGKVYSVSASESEYNSTDMDMRCKAEVSRMGILSNIKCR